MEHVRSNIYIKIIYHFTYIYKKRNEEGGGVFVS